ncbi:23S rRNA N-6-methyltransferase ErmCX [Brevibacterium aurantiacum]|uniref:23S rRNA N-6-methyltransferase ErmCX n=1 Tax=Brevibacterium aurantiacum TaxID=273384 RepID=A0A1D7VZG3_BREAU|nr:23S ribosomal RNA methyltransferase Erm [Brevibacterium aurantiacum]AOP52102.1 23S rRNA N-6-methyltransferase ErmCX [Brevibacterium aurantiacum]RCS98668.1 23S ribosomal RNA methyltransferase Erm [Brevibacterium aurantiacum]
MRPHSSFGGRHELGQNFLHSDATLHTIANLTRATTGPILEIGPGTGAVTAQLYRLGRPLTLAELDETRIRHLEHSFPRAQVRHADVLTSRLDQPVIVGSLPFHLTTPILRRILHARKWQNAILLTQWEVARKRAGVGGSTMMTAQWAPWFDFRLIERVPAHAFTPMPSVDGGILTIDRLTTSLVPKRHRSDYQQFVRAAFTGRGRGMKGILTTMNLTDRATLHSTMDRNDVGGDTLPRDLNPDQWAGLYSALSTTAKTTPKNPSAAQKQAAQNQNRQPQEKGNTMHNDKDHKNPTIPAATGEIPTIAEKPVITGELPIVGAEQAAKKLEAPIPGVDPEAKVKSHDKGQLQAERGFMPQHAKLSQPQPRWNLPRRRG